MNILLIMVPISVAFIALAIWLFAWAVRRGQFDDLETPALDILTEDAPARATTPDAPAESPAPGQGDAAAAGATGGRDAD